MNGEHRAVCTCKKSSHYGTRHEAEDWERQHQNLVQQALVHLRRTPSAAAQLAWFYEQAANPENSTRDRELWAQLADELEHRYRPVMGEQLTLW